MPDWRHTSATPESLLRFESTNLTWKPPYSASKDSAFLNSIANPDLFGSDDLEKLNALHSLPTELRLRGCKVANITNLTHSPWMMQIHPGRQTIRAQALILQENQRQIVDWERLLFKSPSSIYIPTGESNLDARYKTMMSGIDFMGSETHTRAAYLAFERRQKVLRFIVRIGLHRFLWPYIIIVWVGHFLRFLGIQNPEWRFRSSVPGMINRKGARLKSELGDIEYIGLVPGLCQVGDALVVCQGVKVPLVLRERAGGSGAGDGEGEKRREGDRGRMKWELIGDAYVHGAMKGEVWNEQRCADVCIT